MFDEPTPLFGIVFGCFCGLCLWGLLWGMAVLLGCVA